MPFFSEKFSTTLANSGSGGGSYINPSKIPDGGSARFLVLSDEPLSGYELWFSLPDGKSTPRRCADEPTPADIAAMERETGGTLTIRDGKAAIKPFAAFFVYDYDSSAVKVFSATQVSILQELDRLLSDPDFEDLTAWDVEITRTGKGMNTEYGVTMKPTKAKGPVATAAQGAYAEALKAGANLEALFTAGGNPLGSAK